MKYEIIGGSFPAANVILDKGETVVTQAGAMAWSDKDVSMETSADGGFLKSIGRMFSGGSLMLVRHTANKDDSKITFSSSFPGSIKEFQVDANHKFIAQKSAFLVGDEGVKLNPILNKKFMSGLFGGEGFILQEIEGEGTVLAEIDGSVVEIDLKPGEQIKINTGHVALFESTVNYDVETVKGLKNIFFSGQGLFITTLTGPGKVWLQTLTAQDMASKLIPYMPQSTATINVGSD